MTVAVRLAEVVERSTLYAIPALQEDEEPDGPAFFALGAVVAWIYAADTVLSPEDDKAIRQTFRVSMMCSITRRRRPCPHRSS